MKRRRRCWIAFFAVVMLAMAALWIVAAFTPSIAEQKARKITVGMISPEVLDILGSHRSGTGELIVDTTIDMPAGGVYMPTLAWVYEFADGSSLIVFIDDKNTVQRTLTRQRSLSAMLSRLWDKIIGR